MTNAENWGHSHYKSTDLKALITFGAELDAAGQPRELYYVTLTDHDHQEVFQRTFTALSTAIDEINQAYGHWEFVDALEGSSTGGGCSSCSAH
jgi:hypothetical protein